MSNLRMLYPAELKLPYESLSPCTKFSCPKCGNKGRQAGGVVFVVGGLYQIVDLDKDYGDKCPKCQYSHLQRDFTPEGFSQRLRWVCEVLGGKLQRSGDVFPCICQTLPTLRMLGEVELATTVMGDTCFCNDDRWVRALSEVQCPGCHAKGKVALIEKWSYRFRETSWADCLHGLYYACKYHYPTLNQVQDYLAKQG